MEAKKVAKVTVTSIKQPFLSEEIDSAVARSLDKLNYDFSKVKTVIH